jgi:hypothetical protein
MQIESCRSRLEEFEQNLNRELYRYFSGRKDQLEIRTVYADYSDLFSAEGIREVESELKNTSDSFATRRKSLKKFIDFLVEQHLDSHAAPLVEEGARLEAEQTLLWEGMEIALSRVPSYLKNEPDAIKRRKLSERRARTLSELKLRQRAVAQLRSAAVGLGFENYLEARKRISGVDYKQLLNSFDAVLSRLEDGYLERLQVSFEATIGLPLREGGSWDVAYWRKQNDEERVFSVKNLLPVMEATVSELGIRPERPDSVVLDLDPRALKQPRPFCIPIRIPHEIKIVLLPEDGSACYAALLHEIGHAYHFAWTNPSLPVEHRLWGDRSLSESYAFLLEHFVLDPQWLARMLLFTKSKEFLHFQSLFRMFLVRRCAGKLRFAVRLHEQESHEGLPQMYSETMKAYTGLEHLPESWLDALSDGFDSADYLRGWVLESMLREHLRSKYGEAWFLNRSAAGFLKDIWETGQLYRADELCREIGIGDLEPQVLADELLEGLQS